MKRFLEAFFIFLVLWFLFLSFGGFLIFENVWLLILFLAFISAAIVSAFTAQEEKISELEKRLQALENQNIDF